jgi:predicted sugar kinase
MEGDLVAVRNICQLRQIPMTVSIIEKDGGAVVAALNQMVRMTGHHQASLSGHGQK